LKKILSVVCCALLLCGCTMIKENNAIGTAWPDKPGPEQTEESGPGEAKALLYFMNGSEDRLVAELRPLTLGQGKNPAEAAIEELITGPRQGNLKAVAASGITLDHVELSDKIAMVYVKTQGALPAEKERFIFETAAAGTLIDFLNISFVSVFWNGVSAGLLNVPTGPLSKYTGNLPEAFERAKSEAAVKTAGNTIESRVVLYFTARDGNFILPEVRNIVFTGNDYIKAIIDELKKGPRYPDQNNSVIDRNTVLQNAQWIQQNGKNTLVLYFNGLSQPSEFGDLESEVLTYASIVYTLTGFLTGVDSIRIISGEEEITGLPGFKEFPQGMARADFAPLLGKASISI